MLDLDAGRDVRKLASQGTVGSGDRIGRSVGDCQIQ